MSTRFICSFASVFSMILVLQASRQTGFDAVDRVLLVLLAAVYIAFIWLRRIDWKIWAYVGMAAAAIAASLILQLRNPDGALGFAGGNYTSGILWPLVWLLASSPQRMLKEATLMLLPVLAAIGYVDKDAPSMFGTLAGPLGLYLGVRGITFLKEGNRISGQHLKELNEAHEKLQQAHHELQDAAVHSMRFAALTERSRLAREIHDGIGHHLTSLIVQLQALEMMLPVNPEGAAGQLPILLKVARAAMSEVRVAAHDWSQDEAGLGLIALKGLIGQTAAHSGITLELECDDKELSDLPLEASTVLYRILQEALTNMMKHAEATSADIRLQASGGFAVLTVSDNGIYCAADGMEPGYGIKGMASRCEEAGGAFSCMQNEPTGLTVRAAIPIYREEAEDGKR